MIMPMDNDEMKKVASAFGKMGGLANVEKNGKDHMKQISRLGVEARKKKKNGKSKDKQSAE